MSLHEPIPLATQVGGHSGVLTTEDGDLLIKPALPHELEFYQKLQSGGTLAALRPYVPRFIGTLKLEGEVDQDKPQDEVLENISHTFIKPNILDVKLGTILYDEEASPEKVARMMKAARETTSFETGVRLTGFQVYDNITGKPVNTPKSYGKSIKPADLPEGIARFFPVGTPVTNPPTEGSSSGLPPSTLRPIVEAIRKEIQEIRDILAGLEFRMVGGSLLIVYEADWNRAEEGLKLLDCEGEEGEEEEEEEEEEGEEGKKKPGPPCVVKLIDFAHSKAAPGQGPDEGVLLGVDTVLKLLDGRLQDLATL